VTEDERCETEVKIRVALAKEVVNKRKELLSRRMKKETKKKLIKTLVWTTLLYCSETWTPRKEKIERLEAMEMWLWRRMEKISWTKKVTNKEVLLRVGEERQLYNLMIDRKRTGLDTF